MQIPEYWAETRLEGKVDGRRRVLRRFGWSDQSQKIAQIHAEERAATALAELQRGVQVPSRERKLPYGGLGLPIREEIVARKGDDVITRNAYGARCLNQPDVLFADIDIVRATTDSGGLFAPLHKLILIGSTVLTIAAFSAPATTTLILAIVVLVLLALSFATAFRAFQRKQHAFEAQHPGKTEDEVRVHVQTVIDQIPGSRFALYKTPAGLRLLALHRTFDPVSEEVQSMFRALGVDPAYAQMCALQACFRARVSPKPWRMDMPRSPNRRVWPLPDKLLRKYKAWISNYETQSTGYASCRWLGELGSGKVDARCDLVRRMHDEMSQAHANLPIA